DRIKTARAIVRSFSGYEQLIDMQNAWKLIDKDKIDIVIDFVRQLFGPSLLTTDNIVRTSLSTMVRSDSWKARGQNVTDHTALNSTRSAKTPSIQGVNDENSGD
ncbi:unnamed protein product, partial [Rotaria sp. Silwood1]